METIGSGGIFLALVLMGVTEKISTANMPWYVLLGGILGSVFVILSNYTFSKTSVITSTILILAGQFLCALLLDIMVLHITLKSINILGAVIISFAVVFYHFDTGNCQNDIVGCWTSSPTFFIRDLFLHTKNTR